MTDTVKSHAKREPLFRIAQKSNMSGAGKFFVRAVAVGFSLLVIMILFSILTKDTFANNWEYMLLGSFGEGEAAPLTQNTMFNNMMMLLVLSLGLAPAFKMKFWNIGAQGQALIGNLMASMIVYYLGGKIASTGALMFLAFLVAVICGGIWALIPAIAKVKLKANETLFTLMMNYIAIQLVWCFIDFWKGTKQSLTPFSAGHFDAIGGNIYGLTYILASLLTVAMFIYMSKTKHGYELNVVGESINTARYAGINTTKVILRTVFMSGAICAFAGFLYTGNTHVLSTQSDNGYGFTAIIVAWGAHFNPVAMVVLSFIIAFLQRGSSGVQNMNSRTINNYVSYIVVGIFLFFLIGCEFFLNYKFVWNTKIVEKTTAAKNKIKEKMPKTCAFFAKCSANLKKIFAKIADIYNIVKNAIGGFFDGIFEKLESLWHTIAYKFAKKQLAKQEDNANSKHEEDEK